MISEKLYEKILDTVYRLQPEFSYLHGDIVIAHKNKMLLQKCFSYKGIPNKLASNKQMLVGSITKQFAAVCLLKLLYERHAEFQKDVQNIMKDVERDLHMPISQLSFFNDEIFRDKTPGWINKITLHHLLTHTSGIQKETELNFSNNQIFEAGEKFLYTNPNYVLVGKLISNLISESVGSYLSKVIFKPLGMKSTCLFSSGTPKESCQKGIAKILHMVFNMILQYLLQMQMRNITF